MAERGTEQLAQQTVRLIRRLKSKNWIERWQAAYRLGELKSAAATEPLLEVLADPDRDVRKVVLEALGKIGDPRAITEIAKYLNDPDRDLRLSAVRAFGQMKDPKVAQHLIQLLRDLGTKDFEVTKFLIHHLGELEALESVDAILDFLHYEMLESYCIRALSKIGDPVLPKLLEKLQSENEDLRKIVCLALGKMRAFEAVDSLAGKLEDPSLSVRQEALRALAKIGDKRAVSVLVSLLDSSSPLTDEAALHLKRLGHPRAAEYFLKKADARTLEVPD